MDALSRGALISGHHRDTEKMRTKPVKINSLEIGGSSFSVWAGPCAVESAKQFQEIAAFVKSKGASGLRGGIFKPRTNPKDFQGLGTKALPWIQKIKSGLNIPFVSEVTDPRQIEGLDGVVDVYQVGARNMFNYELLKELGKSRRPVLLKRGFSARIREWLYAAAYIQQGGNERIILCERGIRTFETETRNTLDFNAVAYIKKETDFPILVDPSHGTGLRSLTPALAKGAAATGADGLLIEVHNSPETALCDSRQAITFKDFEDLMGDLKKLLPALGKILQANF